MSNYSVCWTGVSVNVFADAPAVAAASVCASMVLRSASSAASEVSAEIPAVSGAGAGGVGSAIAAGSCAGGAAFDTYHQAPAASSTIRTIVAHIPVFDIFYLYCLFIINEIIIPHSPWLSPGRNRR